MTKKELNNSTTVLVLGIISILTSWLLGIGFVFGIIGFILAIKGMKLYKLNADIYKGYGKLKAGFIMSIIGTIISFIYILILIYGISNHDANYFYNLGDDVLK